MLSCACSVFIAADAHVSYVSGRDPDEEEIEESVKGCPDFAQVSQVNSMEVSLWNVLLTDMSS